MLQEIGEYLGSEGITIALILLLVVLINDEKALDRITGKIKKVFNFASIIYFLFLMYKIIVIIKNYL